MDDRQVTFLRDVFPLLVVFIVITPIGVRAVVDVFMARRLQRAHLASCGCGTGQSDIYPSYMDGNLAYLREKYAIGFITLEELEEGLDSVLAGGAISVPRAKGGRPA